MNGGLREKIITPALGMSYALPISGILLCLMIFIPRLGKETKNIYIKMGLLWLFLTILLEAVLGIAMGNTFNEMLNAYNVSTGNLWSIIVLFTGITPYLVAKIRHII